MKRNFKLKQDHIFKLCLSYFDILNDDICDATWQEVPDAGKVNFEL